MLPVLSHQDAHPSAPWHQGAGLTKPGEAWYKGALSWLQEAFLHCQTVNVETLAYAAQLQLLPPDSASIPRSHRNHCVRVYCPIPTAQPCQWGKWVGIWVDYVSCRGLCLCRLLSLGTVRGIAGNICHGGMQCSLQGPLTSPAINSALKEGAPRDHLLVSHPVGKELP